MKGNQHVRFFSCTSYPEFSFKEQKRFRAIIDLNKTLMPEEGAYARDLDATIFSIPNFYRRTSNKLCYAQIANVEYSLQHLLMMLPIFDFLLHLRGVYLKDHLHLVTLTMFLVRNCKNLIFRVICRFADETSGHFPKFSDES